MRIEIAPTAAAEDIAAIRALFTEYVEWLDIDLSYQGFAEELAALPGCYGTPRGRLLLARVDGEPAGCVAMRPIDSTTCEMKRLYVRAQARGCGLGRALAERVMAEARSAGYAAMVLDSLPFMRSAIALYESLGFTVRPPYYDSPLPETVFMQAPL